MPRSRLLASIAITLSLVAGCGEPETPRPRTRARAVDRTPMPRPGDSVPLPSCEGPRCAVLAGSHVVTRGRSAFVASQAALFRIDDDADRAVVLAPVERRVTDVAVSEAFVVFAEEGSLGQNLPDARLVRIDRRDGTVTELRRFQAPNDVAIDGDEVFVIEGPPSGRRIRMLGTGGAEGVVLTTGPSLHELALDAANVYFVRGTALVALDRTTREERILADGSPSDGSALALAADGEGLYAAWQDTAGSGGLRFFPRGTGPGRVLLRQLGVPSDLALLPDRVLLILPYDGLLAIPREGGPSKVVVPGAGLGSEVATTERWIWVIANDPPQAYRIPR